MTHGIDTDFLVAAEITDHPFHLQADALLWRLMDDGHDFALTPQTLAEFIHVVTDSRRMPRPLTTPDAIGRAEHWWHSSEVLHVFPDGQSLNAFFGWLRRHQLGRKRLLDTLFAATLRNAGIRRIISNNTRDFEVLGCFEVIEFK
jgi:predicted nucleic acid-binding protein